MNLSEDRELFGCCSAAMQYGGGFVKTVAQAAMRADDDNYAILRPALLAFKAKYPVYDERYAEMVQRELEAK